MTVEEILQGESKDLEFKEKLPEDSKKYMKTIVAFSNGDGGRLIIGVTDDREVVGVDQTAVFTMIDKITNAISDSCEPLIIPDIAPQAVGDKTVIVVEISAGRQRPYYLKSLGMDKGTFIRTSGSTRLADRPFIQEMYYEDENRSFDNVVNKDIEVTDADIKSFCEDMKKEAQRNYCMDEKDAKKVKTPTKNNLITWGILKEENGVIRPTYAYYYLRGLDGVMSKIQCAVFKGNTRGIFVDKREYEGNLWEQVEQAYQFVLRNIHLGARIKGIHRQDVYELPPESIRELIINAVVNCSYLQGSLVQVAIYDNRLEISSPGGLMPGVTIEKMKEGFSKVRNHGIANAFVYMNLIEQWGSGIPKILTQTKEYGLPEVEFIDMENALRVNMYRAFSNDEKQTIKTNDKSKRQTINTNDNDKQKTSKEYAILEYLGRVDKAKTVDIAAVIGLGPDRTRVILASMAKRNMIVAEGANRNRIYRLPQTIN